MWRGIPDLHVELHEVLAGKDIALARGTVSGTATGRLYGKSLGLVGLAAMFLRQ